MIVLDTNILISALIKDSTTRKIIIESGFEFAYPEISFHEIIKHKEYILNKSGYSQMQLETILNKLLEYIQIVPLEIIKPKIYEAKKIMENIDITDTIFIATALALGAAIWSEDSDFERQSTIKILRTSQIVRLFEKT